MHNEGQSGSGGTRAYPILEGFRRLGVGTTMGAELIRPGANGEPPQLESFMIGRRRYITEEAIQKFVQARVAESLKDTAAERARKVRHAVAGRAKVRAKQRAVA